MVNTLQFNMSVPTPYVFMKRSLKAAESDKKVKKNIKYTNCQIWLIVKNLKSGSF